jgi:biopolymer transport protein ExbD
MRLMLMLALAAALAACEDSKTDPRVAAQLQIKPKGSKREMAALEAEQRPLVVVTIDRAGKIEVAGKAITSADDLTQSLADVKRAGVESVDLDAEPGTPYEKIIALMDAINAAGIKNVGLTDGSKP